MSEISFSIWKDRYEGMTERVRVSCRGIIVKEGKILLSCETNNNWYFIPGGGLEEGETVEQGCMREVQEETGFLVKPETLFAVVDGYYRERIFRNYFFLCSLQGTAEQNLTKEEAENAMLPRWVSLEDAAGIFAGFEQYESSHEMLCQSYMRDYRIVTEVRKYITSGILETF